jgi:squalene-hopene/tetraprenyl-beta-curcumene cyclase
MSTSSRSTFARGLALGLAVACVTPAVVTRPAAAQAPATAPALTATDPAGRAQQLIDRGLAFLQTQQKPDGGWASGREPPAFTALVVRAFVLDKHHSPDSDVVQRAVAQLVAAQQPDGGIYRDTLATYNTAIAVSALAPVAKQKPELQPAVEKAVAYLRGQQVLPGAKSDSGLPQIKDDNDPQFGGWTYGGAGRRGPGRPDLSNVQVTLDALKDAGLKPDDPAFQNALKFATRLQNHSETNDQAWAGDDGGFVYAPGDSAAGSFTTPDGKKRLRSYGSMTYAGLKSFVYAGLSKADPRVQAAWKWITGNWTLDTNPGIKEGGGDPQDGIFYYYHTLARALHEYGEPVIATPDGKQVDWRVAFVEKMASLQQPDGSWRGSQGRWMENNPTLTTAFVVLALHEVSDDLAQRPPKQP